MSAIYEVYLDVMAIQNLVSDLFSLIAVNLFLQRRCGILRILLFACVGTFFNCFLFAIFSWGKYLFCVHCVVQPAVLLLLFQTRQFSEFVKEYVVSYLAGFLLGGIQQVFLMELEREAGYEAAAVLGLVVFLAAILWCRRILKEKMRYCKAELYFAKQILPVRVLNDSGNFLHDPYSGKIVSLIDRELFVSWFQEKPAIRLVPYQSLGCEEGLVEVLTIDGMKIYGTREFYIEKPVIGLADRKLFDGKPYQIIVNIQEL